MNMPLWFSNLVFWSAQVTLLALAAGFLPRLFQIRQPRVLLAYWRALLAISLLLPSSSPGIACKASPQSLSLQKCPGRFVSFPHPAPPQLTGIFPASNPSPKSSPS